MQWPDITEFKDITLTPLFPGSNKKGGLKLAASQPADVLVHERFGRTDPKGRILEVLPLNPEETSRARVIEDPVIYGGLLFDHFGHALSESIHRLWPRFALDMPENTKVAFSPVKYARMTPYMAEALDLHGISQDDVLMITEPLRFRQLFVGPQARQMAGPTLVENYKAMLEPSLQERFPTPQHRRRLYISRLDYLHAGSFYGESEVARQLAAEGFQIIYPERHSLTELVMMLRESSIAIFAEGSAIHALELCGSKIPDVLVISRRPPAGGWRFIPLLKDFCERWMVSDHILFEAGLAESQKKHSGVIDLAAVMRDIQSFCGTFEGRQWTQDWAVTAIDEDVERLISDSEHDTEDHASRAANLRETLRMRLSVVAGEDTV